LSAAGLADFRIGIGHVGVFRALLEGMGVDESTRMKAEKMATSRNLVGLGELLFGASAEVAKAVVALVGTRGGAEAIERARAIASTGEALDGLAETYRLLDSYGLASRVMLDFGIIRSFDYYTGLVMEVYAPGVGFPLGAGGRYDSLLAEFGRPMPAAGCAVGLERLHIAIAEQSETIGGDVACVPVAWESDIAEALAVARGLRGMGIAATVDLEPTTAEELAVQVHERQRRAVLVTPEAPGMILMDPLCETERFTTVEGLIERLSA